MPSKNNKILYLMHIDWDWIKQRPQYIAEGLAKQYDVTVMYIYNYRIKHTSHKGHVKLRPIYFLPVRFHKMSFFKYIDILRFQHVVKKYIEKENPSYIYITFPELIEYIPKSYKGMIIYDCMDDHIAMEKDSRNRKRIINDEEESVRRCKLLLVSSNHLKKVLLGRYNLDGLRILVVRNGFKGPILNMNNNNNEKETNTYEISYFGTISDWFNFEYLQKSLNDFPNLTYKIIGPVSGNVSVPHNNRIKFVGIVKHNDLFQEIESSDALMMPFKVNDVIESVDPVKLYEYINFNKNIITIKYNEVERFSDFVYFYKNYSEFKNKLNMMIKNREVKYSNGERIEFLNENGWDNRVSELSELLKTFKE